MNNESFVNRPSSAAPSPTKPRPRPPTSEADFLAQQQTNARCAIRQTGREIAVTLQDLVEQHPLLTLGGVAVAGALAARMITPPTREERVAPSPAGAGKSSLVAMIEKSVLDVLKTGVESYVAAALAAQQSTASTRHNGESNLT